MADVAGMLLGFLLGLFALFVALLIGSVLVRAAVAVANRVLRPATVEPPDTFGQWDDWDSDEPGPTRRKKSDRVIPEPSLATGMLISFLSGAVNVCGYVGCGLLAQTLLDELDGPDELVPIALLVLVTVPLGFVLLALLMTWLLPTTFGRGLLVAFFHYVIVVVVALGAGTAMYLAWLALV